MTEKVTKRRKKSQAKELRDAKIRELAITGHTLNEIADSVGMERQQVGRILSNDETRELVKALENEIKLLGTEAVRTLMDAMAMRSEHQMMGHAVKAAEKILKSIGALKERLELEHTYPEPTVIEKPDGTKIVLGYKEGKDETSN